MAGQSRQDEGGKVNVNEAGREELMRVNGIERSGADAIIAYREKNGPFRSLQELDPVPGLNRERIQNFADRLTV